MRSFLFVLINISTSQHFFLDCNRIRKISHYAKLCRRRLAENIVVYELYSLPEMLQYSLPELRSVQLILQRWQAHRQRGSTARHCSMWDNDSQIQLSMSLYPTCTYSKSSRTISIGMLYSILNGVIENLEFPFLSRDICFDD